MNEKVDSECNIGEIAGNTCEFVMGQLPEEKKGVDFIKTMIEIFTLCISETIKAGYCSSHYKEALEEANLMIKTDLKG